MHEGLKRLRRALSEHLVPRVKAMGFVGGLAGMRRMTPHGIDVLVIPTFKGVTQLDAGRVPRRRALATRTVRQDWGAYASASSGHVRGTARRRLSGRGGKEVWAFDARTSDTECARIAKEMADAVEKSGLAFWSEGVPKETATEKRARTTARDQDRAMKALVKDVVVPRVRALGFTGTFSGSSGCFRRPTPTATDLLALSIGGGEVRVEAARGKPPRGKAKKRSSPEAEFVMAPGRRSLFARELRPVSPTKLLATAQAIVDVITKHAGSKT